LPRMVLCPYVLCLVPRMPHTGRVPHRPEWKGPRVQVNVMLSPEARKMLRALVRRKKLPQSDVVEALIRGEYGKG
jgi:hypothetical protein